ncbi:MAG: sodium:proline symporter, partial [Clostridia bacterium]|nr:sodium:proline symporter [Clostridia bacterium]
ELPGYLNLFQGYDSANNSAGTYGWLAIVSTLAWGLGYFGMPQILLRFMGISSPSQVKLSRRVASGWVIIALAAATFIGVIGYGMVQNGVIEALQDPEQIIVVIANLIGSYGVIPALIAGVILAGIMAASMSTADSQLLAASSSVSENIFRGTFRINLSERGTILTARFVVIVIALIAMFIAKDPSSSIFEIVSFAWAGFGAAFGPVVLFSLFWKRSNAWGALAGMISGGAMVFIWKFVISSLGGAWGIYELLPSFIISAILIVVVSLLTSPPSKEIEKEFDQVLTMVKNSRG